MLPLILHELERVARYGVVDVNIGRKAERHEQHAEPLPDERFLFDSKRPHAPR